MESIKNILKAKQESKKEKNLMYWQEIALNIIEFTKTPKKRHSAIFKTCKQNIKFAQRSLTACKELNKPFVDYYFKVFNEYGKN